MVPMNLEFVKDLWLPNIFIYNLKTYKVIMIMIKKIMIMIKKTSLESAMTSSAAQLKSDHRELG